jgi:hypothetical protein
MDVGPLEQGGQVRECLDRTAVARAQRGVVLRTGGVDGRDLRVRRGVDRLDVRGGDPTVPMTATLYFFME